MLDNEIIRADMIGFERDRFMPAYFAASIPAAPGARK